MNNLREFTRHPSRNNIHLLRYIPAIHSVVMWEFNGGVGQSGELRRETRGICEWLYVRAHTCYALLKVHDAPSVEEVENLPDDWLKVRIEPN